MDYEQDFPKRENQFLKASAFQDSDIPLTFLGWKKKGNEDIETKSGKVEWKKRLKFMLRYSYPEFALDEAGDKQLDKDGNPKRNGNYDPAFPKGYAIVYAFEEGVLESGSLPLFNAFCMVRPKKGDVITIRREGVDKETKWFVRKAQNGAVHAQTKEPVIHLENELVSPDELAPDEEISF